MGAFLGLLWALLVGGYSTARLPYMKTTFSKACMWVSIVANALAAAIWIIVIAKALAL